MKGVEILSERFLLRSLTPQDATPRYSSWLDDAKIQEKLMTAKRPHAVADLRAYIAERLDRDAALFLGIFERETLEHIGNLKYEPIVREQGYAVMGLLIGEEAWQGRGVAREVLRASGFWLKSELGIKEILLGVYKDNDAAIRAYEKSGFKADPSNKIKAPLESCLAMSWLIEGP